MKWECGLTFDVGTLTCQAEGRGYKTNTRNAGNRIETENCARLTICTLQVILIHLHPSITQQPFAGQCTFNVVASRSHSNTPYFVGLFKTSDQPDEETSTWQHTTLTRDKHTCPHQDSNQQSQLTSDRSPRGQRDRTNTVHRRTGHEDPEGSGGIAVVFL
jgi:hypothetical protein